LLTPSTLINAIFMALLVSLSACCPGYVLQAGYEEAKILLGRQDISELIEQPALDSEIKEKLELVLEARAWAKSQGFKVDGSFKQFSQIDRDVLSYVIMASRPDSFTLYSWWYPIVGEVPYKGYFDKKSALKAARKLKQKGYETYIAEADAFSTLGWFDDPLLSTTLKQHSVRIVNTVIHEAFHSSVWIPDRVELNESAANFAGLQGAVDLFEQRLNNCSMDDKQCIAKNTDYVAIAKGDLIRASELSMLIVSLWDDLSELYESDLSMREKLSRRKEIFEKKLKVFREKYPESSGLRKVNNAEILQLKLYLAKITFFENIFSSQNRSWRKYIEQTKNLRAPAE